MKRLHLLFGAFSILLSANLAPGAGPAAPDFVKVAWIENCDEFLVRWAPVTEATNYNVYRYDTNASAWVQIATNLAVLNVPMFRDPTVPEPGPVTYAVTAVNGEGEGPSTSASLTPQPGHGPFFSSDWDPPVGYTFGQPAFWTSLLDGTDGMLELGLDWQVWTNVLDAAWGTNITFGYRFMFTNLTAGTRYYWRLTAVEANGNGITLASPSLTFVTLPAPVFTVNEEEPTSIQIGHWGIQDLVYLTSPAHGVLDPHWWGDDYKIYTSHTNFVGTDTFQILDNTNGPPVTVTINVQNVNDAPVAEPFIVYAAEDSSLLVTPTVFDIDANDRYAVALATWDHPGGFMVQNETNILFELYTNFVGTIQFLYVAYDLSGWQSEPAQGTIIVTNLNDPPTATNEFFVISEDTPITFDVGAFDIDGDAITLEIVNPPLHGTLTNTGLTVTYTPAPNYFGIDYFTYRVSDGQTNSGLGNVDFSIDPVNDAPAADSQVALVGEDQSVAVALTGSDIDGDTLTFAVLTPPAHGTFVAGVYTPDANYFGSDGFTYKSNDGQADSPPATVSITVTPVNDVPTANNQSVSTPYNTAVNIVLTGSDIEGSALTFTIVADPANGTLSGSGANRTFTPDIGWYGTTSFTFKANDGELDSADVTLTITVASPGSVPAAPSALTATAVSQSQINLAWNDNSANEDGFKIERSPNGNSSWVQIAIVGPNVTTYSNTGLSKNTRYHYRVRAYNVLGNSAYSSTANARTQN